MSSKRVSLAKIFDWKIIDSTILPFKTSTMFSTYALELSLVGSDNDLGKNWSDAIQLSNTKIPCGGLRFPVVAGVLHQFAEKEMICLWEETS